MELSHPFSMIVAGSRKSGKTVFTKHILQYGKDLIKPAMPKRIMWVYAKHQPDLLEELMSIDKNIEYVDGIPQDLESTFDRNVMNLIILDDMMDEASKDERVSQLFTRGRHDNLSVIYLTQNLFHKNQRNISLNSDYIVVFKNPRDASQIVNLARQVMPSNTKFFVWAYRDATKKPFSYLFLDVTPTRDDRFRVSSNIFPHEQPQIMYIPKGV